MHITISFIGAGKVGTALGIYFKRNGYRIAGYYSRTDERARESAAVTDAVAFDNPSALIAASDMIWITTSDDQIEQVVQQILSHPIPEDAAHKTFLHVSGAHSLEMLRPLQAAGYQIAAAHPLMAFTDATSAADKLSTCWFAIEQEEETTLSLPLFFEQVGNHTFTVPTEKKTLYHAAACVLSNYMVTLLDGAYRMFEEAGLDAADVQAATQPLLDSVLENMKTKKPADALTGPIKRGDATTVAMHVDSIGDIMPQVLDLYKHMGRETMEMVQDYKLKEILE